MAKTCSQYMNLVKISQKQYSCSKRNFKPCLVFYIEWREKGHMFTNQKETTLCFRGTSLVCFELKSWSVRVIMLCMCLCVAGRHMHTRHPTATCGMPLREMLVRSNTLLNEMVFHVVIIKYFLQPVATPRSFCIVGLLQSPLCIPLGFDTV